MSARVLSRQQAIAADVERILDHLAAIPATSFATALAPVVRELLLKTDGRLFAIGKQWDIRAKSIGAGVYRITLVECGVSK